MIILSLRYLPTVRLKNNVSASTIKVIGWDSGTGNVHYVTTRSYLGKRLNSHSSTRIPFLIHTSLPLYRHAVRYRPRATALGMVQISKVNLMIYTSESGSYSLLHTWPAFFSLRGTHVQEGFTY